MKNDDKASISLKKILCISIIFIFLTSIAVMAGNVSLKNVKIILSNGYEMNVLTSKSKVSEILEENHILLLENEKSVPDLNSDLSENNTIRITKSTEEIIEVAEKSENSKNVTAEQLLENYEEIVEKIIVEKIKIPYETIKKDVSTGSGAKQDSVVQYGIDGIKEVTYKVKYQNEKQIEKTEISSKIIKKPVDKIVEVRTKQTISRGDIERIPTTNPAKTASTTLANKVKNITPRVKTFNTSAYCACISCCGKTNGITASGARASEWYTIAAGSGYPIGTVIYIPALKNKPNGGWFVVQDRGGAISNSHLDIFFGSHSSALQYGRRSLECYVYEF